MEVDLTRCELFLVWPLCPLTIPQTVSAIYSFFRAMTLHPEIQKRAQKEIDEVIGHDRLPGFADRENLPYLNALCKEVMRTHCVAPIGM